MLAQLSDSQDHVRNTDADLGQFLFVRRDQFTPR